MATLAAFSLLFGAVPGEVSAQALLTGPWVDRLVWREIPDGSLVLEELRADTLDFYLDGIGSTQANAAFESSNILTASTFRDIRGLLFNPNEQQLGLPWNPFTDSEIREAMQWLVDRDFIIREILDGYGVRMVTPFNPKYPDYGRELATIDALEEHYSPDFAGAHAKITERMIANGASIGPSGFWEDSDGNVIDLRVVARVDDAPRFETGNYLAQLLELVGFGVTINPATFTEAAQVVYGDDPSKGAWHVYTEGFSFGIKPWDDGVFNLFHNCFFEPFCARFGPPGTYSPPADFDQLASDLAGARYTSLEERQQWIRDLLPRTLSETNYRMWLHASEVVFATNDRVERFAFGSFTGTASAFTMQTAKLLPDQPGVDPGTGVGGELRVAMSELLIDAWNPWTNIVANDRITMAAIGDRGLSGHPHTGQYFGNRFDFSVETAGPLGSQEECPPTGNASCIPVPPDAIVWELFRDPGTGEVTGDGDRFVNVANGIGAVSKITLTLQELGSWHTGSGISMDDVIYHLSAWYRMAFGDVSLEDERAAPAGIKSLLRDDLKGVRVMDDRTLEVYFDYWHVELGEIAWAGEIYPPGLAPIPWEISEIALQSVVGGVTALHGNTASSLGRIHLDLARNPMSIAALDASLDQLTASTHIPQGMEPWITTAEAAARYEKAEAFRTKYGHWYASNGPFLLERADPNLRQLVMVAFRDGYPFPPGQWDAIIGSETPDIAFGSFPESLLAGTSATLQFSTARGGRAEDPEAARWFVRESSRNFVVLEGEPVRKAVGEFEVQLLSTETVGLETGNFELVVVVQGASSSEVRRFAFTVTSQLDFFGALFDELDARLAGLTDQTAALGGILGGVGASTNSLFILLTGILAMAIAAIVVPTFLLLVFLKRLPPRT